MSALLFALGGAIDRAGIPALCDRVRGLLERADGEAVICDVGAVVDPDASTVDALARLKLTAKRLGYELHLLDTREELRDLLELTGLGGVLRVEPGRQAEEGEQALGVEEEGDPGEPVA